VNILCPIADADAAPNADAGAVPNADAGADFFV
jgi:hypothetical protein